MWLNKSFLGDFCIIQNPIFVSLRIFFQEFTFKLTIILTSDVECHKCMVIILYVKFFFPKILNTNDIKYSGDRYWIDG